MIKMYSALWLVVRTRLALPLLRLLCAPCPRVFICCEMQNATSGASKGLSAPALVKATIIGTVSFLNLYHNHEKTNNGKTD